MSKIWLIITEIFWQGDTRVRQNTMLTVLHTLWVREHNRVANNLFKLFGSSKSDEFYYQEARRIVIAEYQHITYNEFLPMLLGKYFNLLSHKFFLVNRFIIKLLKQDPWLNSNLRLLPISIHHFSMNSWQPLSELVTRWPEVSSGKIANSVLTGFIRNNSLLTSHCFDT